MEFSRQEYWSGLPCPPPEDLPHPGIESESPELAAGFFTLWTTREAPCGHRTIITCIIYHIWNESPVQVWCTILDAWGWCTGTNQRDGKGREEGGGFRMGNTCISVVDSCWYMAKPIQYCKVKKLNKINSKKKSRVEVGFSKTQY